MDMPATPTPDAAPKADTPAAAAATAQSDDLNTKIEKDLQERLRKSKDRRKEFLARWRANVQARMGQLDSRGPGGLMTSGGVYTGTIDDNSDLQSTINPDWSLTKMKTANLFSQVPTVQGTHENTMFAPAVPPFMKALNYELSEKRTNIAVAMEEVLADVVNASGIAAVYVDYQARFRKKRVPMQDPATMQPPIPPEQLDALMKAGAIPSTEVPERADYRFGVTRISPRDLLWPAEFIGSWFDHADWNGYDGRMSWADAVNTWTDEEGAPILQERERDDLTTGPDDDRSGGEDLRISPNKDDKLSLKKVHFSHLFYWRHRFDAEEKCFSCIWEIVFVKGREAPVLHRPWKGQRLDPQTGRYLGAQKFPVRIVTLTYITDNPVPPSDTDAGRPQVNDLRLSRTQLMQQRARNVPVRGFDVNRVDPMIADLLMRGQLQGWVPFQGKASDAIWEVARASYPKEDTTFDQETQADLFQVWGFSGVQAGQSQHRQTKAESQSYASQFQTLFGQERNKFARFFLETCEVLAGLMALYSDFPTLTPQEQQQMKQTWDSGHVLHDLVMSIRPDSQVVLDAGMKVERLAKILNLVGKSGFVNPKPLIAEILEWGGIDPMGSGPFGKTMIDPQPKPPEEPTLSLRASGKDDLMNPLVLAFFMQAGKMPSPEMIEEAKRALLLAQMPPEPPKPEPQQPGQPPKPPARKVPPAPDVQFDEHQPVIPGVGGQPGAHPDWSATDKVAKRTRDLSG